MTDSKRIVQLKDIEKAQEVLNGHIVQTSIAPSRNCSQWLGANTFLKYENYQMTGSFKVRGAFNKIQSLSDSQKQKGIIASSAGNHAQGVAYSANKMNINATIVMPVTSPMVKQQATQSYGADIILHGDVYDEAYEHSLVKAKAEGLTFVHPYNDPMVIAGQGTIALEILNQLNTVTDIIVPIGGGGLISGMAVAIKSIKPEVKVYGVVSENAPGMEMLFQHSKSQKFFAQPTIADGIAVKKPSKFIYENYISKYVDDIITVSDNEIAQAIVFLMERAKTVVEGSAATALAAAKKSHWKFGDNLMLLLSGGNIDLNLVSSVIERGQMQNGRLARIKVLVEDKPGALVKVTRIIANLKANVLEVQHDRLAADVQLKQAAIEILMETKSAEHVDEIKNVLIKKGAKVL